MRRDRRSKAFPGRQQGALQKGDALSPEMLADLKKRTAEADRRQAARQLEEALQALDGAAPPLTARPEYRARKATLLAMFRAEPDRLSEAERIFRKLVADGFTSVGILTNFANLLMTLGKFQQAEQKLKQALALQPDLARTYEDLGKLYLEKGEWSAAEAEFNKALQRDANLPRSTSALGHMKLGFDNFSEGWPQYAARMHAYAPPPQLKSLVESKPLWDGDASEAQPTLLWREQGVGEQIMFGGLAPEIAEQSPVALFVDARLTPLLKRNLQSENLRILSEADKEDLTLAAEYSRTGPIGALGRAARPSLENFPTKPAPFLSADPAKVAEFSEWLASLGEGPKIGLSWRSSLSETANKKTVPLKLWAPILKLPTCRFVDLQYGPTEDDRAEVKNRWGVDIHSHPTLDRKNDFEGAAALVEALDLVVTIDNSMAHLSGALGQKTLLMLAKAHFWYWGYHADAPPRWYRNVERFRRSDPNLTPDGWKPVVKAVSNRLSTIYGL